MELIPREWNVLADRLAAQGSPELALFQQGRDLPKWLMKLCSISSGFHF